jgi:hypothetical protein
MKRIELSLWFIAFALVIVHVLFVPRVKADELTDAINVERARHGLPALAHEPILAGQAAQNNRFGFGHHYLGSAILQNAAWNIHSVGGVVASWMQSPGHRSAILSPYATACGGAYDGICWTLNFGHVSQSNQAAGPPQMQVAASGWPATSLTAACSTSYPGASTSEAYNPCGRSRVRRLFWRRCR